MNELSAELPAAGVVRIVGPEEAGAGFLVSDSGLIVTCAHVLAGCVPGATVSIEPHVDRRSLPATVDLLQDPPDVAVLRLIAPVPPGAVVLPLGRSPRTPQPGLRTFGYPQMRPEAGLPGELAVQGPTAADGYDQLALRSEEATLGFSGAPIWDPELGVVVGMVKSIARGDPGKRLGNTAIGVPVEIIRELYPELRLPAGCPYRGLEPFTEEHVDYYYGREHATSQLLTSLAAGHFVPVVAVSGGGKSSLLQAGLAKGLRDRPVVGLAQRIRCYQRVSGQPHAELLHSLAQHGILLPQELAAAPTQELAAAIRGAVPPTELIVVVDQFERLYTDCEDAAERKRFVELLIRLATETVKVVIGLRADFYHLALADLGERLADGQVALAPMSDKDLGQVIAAPAEKLLRSFQPGLTQQLIADVRGRPGDLPLLQFALTELWERDAVGGVLTQETYRGLGVELPDGTHLPGVRGALIRRAEQLWQDLGPAGQLRLQRILLGLIAAQPAETSAAGLVAGTRDLSRPARLAQWDEDDQRLIERLIDARLLTADRAPAGGQPTVEVSHEALLRAWPRLQSWLDKRSKFVQWRAQDLAPNLERWLDSNKNPEFLLPRSLLDPALRWLNGYPDELAGPPARYIQASKRHRTRRRRLINGVVAVLVVASLTAAGIFYSLQQTAIQRQNVAVSRLLIIESETLGDTDPVISKLLSVAAWRINPSSDARYAMLSAAARPRIADLSNVISVAFSPDNKTLAAASADGKVQLWDVATHQPIGSPLTGLTSSVKSVAFSPDGKILASGGTTGNNSAGKVQLWDVATHQQIGSTLTFPGGSVDSVAFSADGTLAIGGNDNSGDNAVWLWDVATHQQIGSPLTGPPSAIGAVVAFSPDGKTLAAGNGDGMVRLWDVATHQQIGSLPEPAGVIGPSVAFSPDGKTLAIGGGGLTSGTVQLWDVATQQQVGIPFNFPGGPLDSVAFSPDGKTLATSSADGTVQLWDAAIVRQQIGSPLPRAGYMVAFSPDGKTLATGKGNNNGNGNTVQLWDVATHQQIGSSLNDNVSSVAFSPDGKTLATGNGDDTVRLWDVATHQQIGSPLPGEPAGPFIGPLVAFSADGTLAIGNGDGTVGLWDVATHQQIGSTLTFPGARLDSVAFSPDGKTLAAGNDNGTVRLWDVATHQQIGSTLTGPTSAVNSMAFSPDGKTLATGIDDGDGDETVRLWDVATHQQIGSPLTGPTSSVNSVAFSPDGKILAVGNDNGTVWLWDVATHQQIGSPLNGHIASSIPGLPGSVWSVAFSPDGKTLATANEDSTVRLWDITYLTDLVPHLCTSAGRSLTPTEWARYAPGLAYRSICP